MLVDLLRIAPNHRTEELGVEQLKHDPRARAASDHVVGDSSWNAQHKRGLRVALLKLGHAEVNAILVELHHRFVVEAKAIAAHARGEELATFD